MVTFLLYIYFFLLTLMGFYLLYKPSGVVSVPFNPKLRMRCTGTELLLIFMFSTGMIGIFPVLSLRLGVLELLCIIGIIRSPHRMIFSWPMILFATFVLWLLLGLTYTENVVYGVRMILKYIYPLLIAMFASSVVRDKEIFLKSAVWARGVAAFSLVVFFVPYMNYLFYGVFWGGAAAGTHYINMSILSLGMAYYSSKKIKNIAWAVVFALPCFIWVYRTDIFGLGVALAVFFFVKYGIKSLPLVALVGILGICSIFYIPSVKKKMYHNPDIVTFEDFITGNVDDSNVNTSGRGPVWEDVQNWFFKDHEIIGSGTGRVQTYFYEEAIGWRRGGQLHNDFLVLLCDNGLVGLLLFAITYIAVVLHCMYIYRHTRSGIIQMAILVSASSMVGVCATMYSDNTLSYSMATLSYPWAIYGMALGMYRAEKQKRGNVAVNK